MAVIPPYLKPGDTIGIVCPSGFMPYEKAQTCINVLQEWGYNVKIGKTLGRQCNYFSGTDKERLDDLQEMMDDKNVDAILFGRGGYGLTRIVDKICFKKFCKKPKWLIGYSDITILHSHLYRRYKIASLHSPMAAAFNDEEFNNPFIQSLKDTLQGTKAEYKCETHPYNIQGETTGKLVGGNLSLLAHLTGTPSDVKTKNKILFLEDIGEYIYHVDRLLYQLKRSGKFNNLAGLVIGGFTDMKDTTTPFGKTVYEVIYEITKGFDFPVCFQFPVGHSKENYPLKIGVAYALHVNDKEVRLTEK